MRRVVITGIGLVSPVGVSVASNWHNLCAGISGINSIRAFDAADYDSRVAGEVTETPVFEEVLTTKDRRKMGRFIQLGMVAAHEAVEQAALPASLAMERVGVMLGSGIGGLPEIEAAHDTLTSRGPKKVSPFFIPSILTNLFAGHVSIKYGFKGPNSCVSTACATSAHAVGDAFRLIQHNQADVMLAGGAEASVCPLSVSGFAAARALSTGFNDAPAQASRPFDAGRDGFVIAEGAAVLVLEELEHAKARGVRIWAEITGYGMSGDAYHMTSPSEDGDGAKRAMQAALRESGVDAAAVDYVNAHATSTPLGDAIEARAIYGVCGENAFVSSTKSMTGHMLGAAGGYEAAVCALALHHQQVPGTINLLKPEIDVPLKLVAATQNAALHVALNNSFGFGGTNASLVMKKWSEV